MRLRGCLWSMLVVMATLVPVSPVMAQTAAPAATTADRTGPYMTMLRDGLASGNLDLAALRKAYAADPSYDGSSLLWEMLAGRMLADQSGSPAAEWTVDQVMFAMSEDFPLLETQYAAFLYAKTSSDPKAAGLMDGSAGFFQDLMKVVLGSEQPGPDGPVYTVLSVSEERMVIEALGRQSFGQALVQIAGRPHDRIDTDAGPVYFDISTFFGK